MGYTVLTSFTDDQDDLLCTVGTETGARPMIRLPEKTNTKDCLTIQAYGTVALLERPRHPYLACGFGPS